MTQHLRNSRATRSSSEDAQGRRATCRWELGRRQQPRKAPLFPEACKLVLGDTHGSPCQTAGALGPESVPALGAAQCWAGSRPENGQVVSKQAIFKSTVYTNTGCYDAASGRMALKPQMRDALQPEHLRMVWMDEQKLLYGRTRTRTIS